MKYIFVVGAPGSKWSSVCKNIYYSDSIDRSDYTSERTYCHDASGKMELLHMGAYFDPGMEFGDWFDQLNKHTKEECEAEFDRPFSGNGIRIIKSHVFSHHISFLRENWPECPIVLVHRPDDACLGWWVKCGHFNITYPDYHKYYRNLRAMSMIIAEQNKDILHYTKHSIDVTTNIELCLELGLNLPDTDYYQDYNVSDVSVSVLPFLRNSN